LLTRQDVTPNIDESAFHKHSLLCGAKPFFTLYLLHVTGKSGKRSGSSRLAIFQEIESWNRKLGRWC